MGENSTTKNIQSNESHQDIHGQKKSRFNLADYYKKKLGIKLNMEKKVFK